jgi:predicted dehydrogenase
MDTISWGVLGASTFALHQMARAVHEAEGSRFAALATSSPAKAEPFLAFAPGLQVHGSYEELLADPRIDAVYIPLPNHLHVEWTLQALEAGKHVLTEKPIAMRASDIDTLIAARDRSGLFATEAYMIVHHPQWPLVRSLLDDGAIGELRHVDAVFTFDSSGDPDNIRNRPETGGGSIPDVGVYTYGSVRFAARAEPVRLSSRIRRENDVDVWTHVTGTMAGPSGEFSYSAMTSLRLHPRQEVVFHGSTGLIRVVVPFNAGPAGEAQVHVVQGSTVRIERFTDRQYTRQVEAFVRHVRSGEPFPWSLEDARGTQLMIEQVLAGELY